MRFAKGTGLEPAFVVKQNEITFIRVVRNQLHTRYNRVKLSLILGLDDPERASAGLFRQINLFTPARILALYADGPFPVIGWI